MQIKKVKIMHLITSLCMYSIYVCIWVCVSVCACLCLCVGGGVIWLFQLKERLGIVWFF